MWNFRSVCWSTNCDIWWWLLQFASDLDYLDMSNSPWPQLRSQLVFKVPWRWVTFLTFILNPVVPPEELPSKKIAQFFVPCQQNIIRPVYGELTFLSTSNKLGSKEPFMDLGFGLKIGPKFDVWLLKLDECCFFRQDQQELVGRCYQN